MAKTAPAKPDHRSLATRIADTEQRILERRRTASARQVYLEQRIRRQLTSPTVLLLAGGIGFVVGELLRGEPPPTDDPAAAPAASPLARARDHLVAWARPLFLAELGKVMQSASSVASVQIADQLARLFNQPAEPS